MNLEKGTGIGSEQRKVTINVQASKSKIDRLCHFNQLIYLQPRETEFCLFQLT